MSSGQPKWTAHSMIGTRAFCRTTCATSLSLTCIGNMGSWCWRRIDSERCNLPLGCDKDETSSTESCAWSTWLPGHTRCVRLVLSYLSVSYALATGTIKHVVQYDGLRGFYRGLGPTLLGYLPTWAIYFAVYDGIKTAFGEPPLGVSQQQQKDRDEERLYPAAQAKGYQPVVREHPWSLHILSAMTAGATSTICTNPLWVIKTRFMVRTSQGPPAECS